MMLCTLMLLFAAHGAERQFWVEAPTEGDRATLQALPLGFAEGQRGAWFRMVGDDTSTAALERSGLRHEPIPTPPPAPPGYASPDDMNAALMALADERPDLVEAVHTGWSVEGRDLLALRITAATAPRLGWRVLGTHHGDELSSAELALATAQRLVSDYGEDDRASRILDRDVVWVWPHVNPDGVELATRGNAHGVDLNRNYAHEWDAGAWAAGPSPFSEPETRAVRTLSTWTALGAGLSMHAGEINLGWVWNHTTTRVADDALLEGIAEEYLASCTVPDFWITNGADWYVTTGDTNDWSYGRHGVLDYTLEISLQKTPAAADMPGVIEDHIDSVVGFLDEATVLWGQVLTTSAAGLEATVTLEGGSPGLSTGPMGHFGRPVGPGPWTVTVTAVGHTPQTLTVVNSPFQVILDPTEATDVRPSPPLLSRSGDGQFVLPEPATAVVLHRRGEASVDAAPDGQGWRVDPSALTPGPWSLEIDGAVARNALFIGEHVGAPVVELTGAGTDSLRLSVDPPVVGVRAWAVEETLRPVPVSDDGEGNLTLTVGEAGPEPLDLIVLAGGHQIAVLDALGNVLIDQPEPNDTGTPRPDTGPTPGTATSAGSLTACGCSTHRMFGPLGLVFAMLAAVRRRSRSRSS